MSNSDSLYEKFNEFLDYKDMDEYQKYLNLVKMSLTQDKICPECAHQVALKKGDDVDAIQVLCKDKCGWYLEFKFPTYINLYEKLFNLKKERTDIVYKIIGLLQKFNGDIGKEGGVKKSFEELKRQYVAYGKKIEDIEKIFGDEAGEMEELVDERFDIFNKLIDMYTERQNIFRKIKKRLLRRHKLELMRAYDNKLPKDKLYQMGGKMGITPEDVDAWIKWFGYVMKYKEMLDKLHELTEEEQSKKDYIDEINMKLMVEMPVVKELKLAEKDKKKDDGGFLSKYEGEFDDGVESIVEKIEGDESESENESGEESDDDIKGGGFFGDVGGEAHGGVVGAPADPQVVSVPINVANPSAPSALATEISALKQGLDEAEQKLNGTQVGAPVNVPVNAPVNAPVNVPVDAPVGVPAAPAAVPAASAAVGNPVKNNIMKGTLDPHHRGDPLYMIPKKRANVLTPLRPDAGGGRETSMKINLSKSQMQHLGGSGNEPVIHSRRAQR